MTPVHVGCAKEWSRVYAILALTTLICTRCTGLIPIHPSKKRPAPWINWLLAQPGIDVAIVGARTPSQLEQTAQAGEIHLVQATLQEIERIMSEAVPFGGPAPEGM